MRDMHEVGGEIKAGREPYFKFYIDDWIAGTRGLSDEQKGFYVDLLCLMYGRHGGLPNDLDALAEHLGKDRRKVRRLLGDLLAKGKLKIVDDCIVNGRVQREMLRRQAMSEKQSKNARRLGKFGETSGQSPGEVGEKSPQTPVPDVAKSKAYENLPDPDPDPEKEKEKEGKPFSWTSEFARDADDDGPRVVVHDGKLTLRNGLRSYWLDRFDGDEQRLELGLIQAAGYVQPNSPRPLETQVSAQLARQCADKRDRAANLATVVAQREAAKPKTKFKPSRW